MDSIWNCAFGCDADIQNNSDNEYFDRCEEMFAFLAKPKFLDFLSSYLHEFQPFVLGTLTFFERPLSYIIDFSKINPIFWFVNHVFEIVEMRKSQKIKKKDYLQLLLDAESDSQDKIVDNYVGIRLNKKLTLMVKNLFYKLF